MRILKIISVVLVVLSISACSTRMGQFTAASTMNVRNLDYTVDSKTMAKAKGESCLHFALIFPIGDHNDRIQRAMDNAIQNGRAAGLDGDLLVNARVDIEAWSIGIYGQNCVVVVGDLVSIEK